MVDKISNFSVPLHHLSSQNEDVVKIAGKNESLDAD